RSVRSFAKPLLPRPTPPSPYEADASNLHSIPSSAWPQREAIPRTRTQAGGKGLTVEGRKRAVNEGEVFGKSESSRRLIERNARRPSVEGRARRGGAGAS